MNLSLPKQFLLFLFILPVLLPAAAEAQQKANPFLRNFEPDEYGAHNQVWQITQTQEGHIAIATGSGIVIYDGEEFAQVAGPPLMVTDLVTASDGSMYYGANNVIGRILKGTDGLPHYHSLADRVDPENQSFGTVWNILVTDDGILIPTRNKLFRYSGEHFEVHPALENTFFKAFEIDGNIYIGELNTGLLRINNDNNLELVPGGEALANEKIPYFILPYDEYRMVIGTIRSGLFWYYTHPYMDKPRGTLEPFSTEADELLKSGHAVAGIELHNGNYAIGTSTAGIFIINRSGELVQVIDKTAGLQTEVVHDLFEDRQGNLWIALNFGFALAEITSPVSYYNDQNGLEGSVIYAKEVNGTLYAATSLGLYRKDEDRFVSNPEVRAPTWDLASITDSGREKLLAANNFGLYLVDGEQTTRLFSNYTMSVFPSKTIPGRIYAGTPTGLFYLEKRNGEFTPAGEIINFENPVRQILEDENGGVWVATQSDGIRYVTPDFDPDAVIAYRRGDGYFVSHNSSMLQVEGELYVSTISSFYKYDSETNTFTEWRSPGLSEQELLGIYRFYHKNGTFWAGASSDREYITEYRNLFSDSVERIDSPFRPVPFTVTLVINEMFGDIWFGNARGLFQYSQDTAAPGYAFRDVHIRKMEAITDTTLTINPGTKQNTELPFSNARIRFTAAAPWYDTHRFMEYRYLLEPHDRQWSEWTQNHIVEYTSLRENKYNFRVEARNREGVVSAVTSYAFLIRPPWYRTLWAYVIYILLFAGLIYASARSVNRYQTRKLEAFNRELEQQVEERSIEIRKQNEELKQMNQEKNDFMNIAVHDLRNPLSGIQGIASLITQTEGNLPAEEVRKYGHLIHTSSVRMFELIDNYLNAHRIEQGQVTANPEPVALDKLCLETVQRFKRDADAKNMKLLLRPAETETIVLADPSLTAQILDNLVSNAIKYSPPGSSISIETGKRKKHGTVTVTDQGPGISKENQEKLYQKFSRIGTKPTGGEVSIGLGLAIVKQLVGMMNGDIRCESEPGKGAAFTVFLPLI